MKLGRFKTIVAIALVVALLGGIGLVQTVFAAVLGNTPDGAGITVDYHRGDDDEHDGDKSDDEHDGDD